MLHVFDTDVIRARCATPALTHLIAIVIVMVGGGHRTRARSHPVSNTCSIAP